MGPEAVFCFINFSAGYLKQQTSCYYTSEGKNDKEKKNIRGREKCRSHLESNGLIWFSSKKQVLPATIGRLNALFVSRHEAMPGSNSFSDLWIINLMGQEKKVSNTWPLLLWCCETLQVRAWGYDLFLWPSFSVKPLYTHQIIQRISEHFALVWSTQIITYLRGLKRILDYVHSFKIYKPGKVKIAVPSLDPSVWSLWII